MATAHAKNRPPSAAKRWIHCPFAAQVAPLYPNDETEASLKGDTWHKAMEDKLTFGALPLDCDPDMAEAMEFLYERVKELLKLAGPGAELYIERRLDIPQTGEFGTGDIVIVSPTMIIIADEKSGYVVVDVVKNEQMLTYLLGAIAEFGPRPKYLLGIHQPNYDHIDGPWRTWEPDWQDVVAFEDQVIWSMENPNHVQAGSWCKGTYCQHRGACEAFRVYTQNDLSLGWHPTELKGMSDADLAKALDAADELAGYRQELRSEAMRRIMNMDRKIHGYKMVKGRRDRDVKDAKSLVRSVRDNLGEEWARRLFTGLDWIGAFDVLNDDALKFLGSPKHIEDVIKQYARQYRLPRGGWKKVYDNVVGEYILEQSKGLTLERAIDGRPAHRRGSEFGVLNPATEPTATNVANSHNAIVL